MRMLSKLFIENLFYHSCQGPASKNYQFFKHLFNFLKTWLFEKIKFLKFWKKLETILTFWTLNCGAAIRALTTDCFSHTCQGPARDCPGRPEGPASKKYQCFWKLEFSKKQFRTYFNILNFEFWRQHQGFDNCLFFTISKFHHLWITKISEVWNQQFIIKI